MTGFLPSLTRDVRDLLERGQIVQARRALYVLLDRFRTHESEETKLILDLEDLARKPATD